MLLQTKVQWRIPSDCQTPPDTRLSPYRPCFSFRYWIPSSIDLSDRFALHIRQVRGIGLYRWSQKKKDCLFYLEGSASSCSWTWLNYIVADDLPRSDLSASRFQQHTPPSSTATLTMDTE